MTEENEGTIEGEKQLAVVLVLWRILRGNIARNYGNRKQEALPHHARIIYLIVQSLICPDLHTRSIIFFGAAGTRLHSSEADKASRGLHINLVDQRKEVSEFESCLYRRRPAEPPTPETSSAIFHTQGD